MSKKYSRFTTAGIIAIILFSVFFPACRSGRNATDEGMQLPTATWPPEPTLAPDRVLLIPTGESNPEIILEAESLISQLAAASGLEMETREGIDSTQITGDIKIIVFLKKPENLGSLAANAPSTQFMTISDENWNPANNVTIIKTHLDQTAFLAGYLSALLAPNFRVGALLAAEDLQFNQAFLTGVQYYCGTCTSVNYPLGEYPVLSTQPSGSAPAVWQAAADQVSQSAINVLFVAGEAYSPELFNYLAGMNMALIGTSSPPPEAAPKWVVTVRADGLSPMQEVWEKLLAGEGGHIINADFKIANYQYLTALDGIVWLSEGKMNFLKQTIDLLREGLINPSSIIN